MASYIRLHIIEIVIMSSRNKEGLAQDGNQVSTTIEKNSEFT